MVDNFSIAFEKELYLHVKVRLLSTLNNQVIKSIKSDLDFDLFLKYHEQRSSEINMTISVLEHLKKIYKKI